MAHKIPPASQQKPSHVKDLVLLFSIPIAIALFAAAVVYAPKFFAKPGYDFIYTYCPDYSCRDTFTLDSEGRIQGRDTTDDAFYYGRHEPSVIRYYDASENATRSLTREDASTYRLINSSKSPDGYILDREKTGGGFLFWGNYSEGWYLKNGLKKKQIQLAAGEHGYTEDVKFLGWVAR